MEKVMLEIDGQKLTADRGTSILKIALDNKIFIPHLCYHQDLKPSGSCRLCLVELDGGKIVTSCRTIAKDGMVVKTNTEYIDKIRRPIIEMIVANHHMDCRNCPKKGQCQLQRIMAYVKIDKNRVRRLRLPEKELQIDNSNPFFYIDHNKCVLCGICVRTCQEIVGMNSIEFAGRGINTKVSTFGDKPIAESNCISCGECVIRCPVGAMIIKDSGRYMNTMDTVCPYCGLGCGISVGTKDSHIVSINGDSKNSINKGLLCVKGRFGYNFVKKMEDFSNPLVKKKDGIDIKKVQEIEQIKNIFEETTWENALDLIAKRLRRCKEGEFALISSFKCTNEDNYIAQKFARVAMKTNNIDSLVRLYDAPTLKTLIDTNAIFTLRNLEIEGFSSILVIGADVTATHPVLSMQIKKAVSKGIKLITINPYETDFNISSDLYLMPYPGTESALVMGICKFIVDENLHEIDFINEKCENYEAFLESLENFTAGRVERITGIPRDLVEESAKILMHNKPVLILWSSKATKYINATNNVYSFVNLSLLLKGQIYPLWEKYNTYGTALVGCIPEYYPFLHPISVSSVREYFESLWKTSLNSKEGITLYEILDRAANGKIKVLYIIGSDLISYIAPNNLIIKALKKTGFIVVQDILLNDTCIYADVVLPARSSFEKQGTIISSGLNEQTLNKILEINKNVLYDWEIMCKLANKMGVEGFNFASEKEIKAEMDVIKKAFILNDVKYKFNPVEYTEPAEVTDIDYPLLMIFKSNKYVDGLMSRNVEGLRVLDDKEVVFISSKDAMDFDIEDKNTYIVESKWGRLSVEFVISDIVPPGVLLADLPFYKINKLLNPKVDDKSKNPETNLCAVRLKEVKKRKSRKKA